MAMLDHVDFAVSDLPRSHAFYSKALAPLGILPLIDIERDDGRQAMGYGRADTPQRVVKKLQPTELE